MKKSLILFILSPFLLNIIFAQTATLETTLEIKNINGTSVPYQNNVPLPSFEKQKRKMINLAGTWKKQRVAADDNITLAKRDSVGYANLINEAGEKYLSSFDDAAWEDKILPSVENQMYDYPTVPEYFKDGVWYRRNFDIEISDSGKFAQIVFLAVNYVADVWINGKYIGYHEGGYTPFSFDVSKDLNFGGTNTIAVRVDVIAWGARNDVIPTKSVDWFNYGGIIHDVYLEFSNQISVVRNDIKPLDLDGNLTQKIIVRNNSNIASTVDAEIQIFEALIDSNNFSSEVAIDLIGNQIAFNGESNTSIEVPADSIFIWQPSLQINNPNLWSPQNPNLYIMKVTLKKDDQILDEFYSQFGIRIVKTSGNKFLLNDRVMFLTGVARHEDHPVYGRSLPKEIIKSDLEKIHTLNVNLIRTAHYPNHPYTYLILDRLGINAMEEIPLWQVDDEPTWLIQNNRKIHLQMFREMVYKDYNRPSIVMWSLSNECHEETNRLIYNQMVVDDFNENYDDGRLISQSPAADNPGPTDITQNSVDVAGWTMYFGIFHGSSYFGGTYNFLNLAKTAFPEKPIVDTEFGYWSSENNSTLQDQVTVATETFKAFKLHAALNIDGTLNKNGSLMGCTWWCAFDWYAAGHPRGFQSMGLFSMDRQTAKPVVNTLKSLYLPYYLNEGVLTDLNGLEIEPLIENNFELRQNYPNPFNPTTVVEYSISEESLVKISLYNTLGERVHVLVDSSMHRGHYKLTISSNNLASGVYICRMNVKTKSNNEIQKSIKITLMK